MEGRTDGQFKYYRSSKLLAEWDDGGGGPLPFLSLACHMEKIANGSKWDWWRIRMEEPSRLGEESGTWQMN